NQNRRADVAGLYCDYVGNGVCLRTAAIEPAGNQCRILAVRLCDHGRNWGRVEETLGCHCVRLWWLLTVRPAGHVEALALRNCWRGANAQFSVSRNAVLHFRQQPIDKSMRGSQDWISKLKIRA